MDLRGKKINFLGDSITQGVGASSADTCCVSQFAKMTGAICRKQEGPFPAVTYSRWPAPQ